MPVMNDIDLSSLRMQHNLNSTPSSVTFTLARRHDNLDYDLNGNYDEITNQNKIQIYDGSKLLFTGYITQIRAISSTDTVEVTAEDVRCKLKNVSFDIFWGGQYFQNITIWKYYEGTINFPSPVNIWCQISSRDALNYVFGKISSYISGHDNLDFYFVPEYTALTGDAGSVIDSLITSSANMSWYTDANEYLRFQKVEQGTIKNLALSGLNSQRHTYDTILNDVTLNKISDNNITSLVLKLGTESISNWRQIWWFEDRETKHDDWWVSPFDRYSKELNWTWFTGWQLNMNDPEWGGWIPNPHKYDLVNGIWEGRYYFVGEGVAAFPNHMNSKGEFVDELFKGQYLDSYYNGQSRPIYGTTLIGSGSGRTKTIDLTSYGRKVCNKYYGVETIDEETGLYEIQEEQYNYISYAYDTAYFELSQNNKLLTEANVTLLLDAFEYYNISFSDLINLTNTIQSGIYQNTNGFPLNISSYSIDFSNRTVSLNLTNYGKTYRQRTGNYMNNYQIPSKQKIDKQLSQEEISDLE
jgi:hypothetical protein